GRDGQTSLLDFAVDSSWRFAALGPLGSAPGGTGVPPVPPARDWRRARPARRPPGVPRGAVDKHLIPRPARPRPRGRPPPALGALAAALAPLAAGVEPPAQPAGPVLVLPAIGPKEQPESKPEEAPAPRPLAGACDDVLAFARNAQPINLPAALRLAETANLE